MNRRQPDQLQRLLQKGLFDENLRKKRYQKKKKKIIKISFFGLFFLLFILLVGLFYQLIPTRSLEISPPKTSTASNQRQDNQTKKNVFRSILPLSLEEGLFFNQQRNSQAINILVLGRPGDNYPGANLTDTLILAHLKPEQKKAVLISLPRDLLVRVSGQNQLAKINSLYNLVGINGLKEKIKEITGLSVDYYLLIDLVVAKEIIDLVDGLNVYVPQDIYDPYFPGPNRTYQPFALAAGWRYLDGETALKYARTRYTSPNGDFDRMARQQQIIQLLKQKVLELNPLWDFPTYLKIFNTLKEHIETDLSLIELKSLYQTVKEMKSDQIQTIVIDKKQTNLLVGGLVPFGNQMASVVYPKIGQGHYDSIQKYIKKYTDD